MLRLRRRRPRPQAVGVIDVPAVGAGSRPSTFQHDGPAGGRAVERRRHFAESDEASASPVWASNATVSEECDLASSNPTGRRGDLNSPYFFGMPFARISLFWAAMRNGAFGAPYPS